MQCTLPHTFKQVQPLRGLLLRRFIHTLRTLFPTHLCYIPSFPSSQILFIYAPRPHHICTCTSSTHSLNHPCPLTTTESHTTKPRLASPMQRLRTPTPPSLAPPRLPNAAPPYTHTTQPSLASPPQRSTPASYIYSKPFPSKPACNLTIAAQSRRIQPNAAHDTIGNACNFRIRVSWWVVAVWNGPESGERDAGCGTRGARHGTSVAGRCSRRCSICGGLDRDKVAAKLCLKSRVLLFPNRHDYDYQQLLYLHLYKGSWVGG
jgi:hypothetical protein